MKKLSPEQQIDTLNNVNVCNFESKLPSSFSPTSPKILQVNVGYLCNQQCTHCHVDASPYRKEIMSREIMQSCISAIDKLDIKTIDITGGAPEMNPDFKWFIEELSKRGLEIIVRSNLTILMEGKFKTYPHFLKKNKVTVISSLPCYTEENTDNQRGKGVFEKSIKALQTLNDLGYGKDQNLPLHLVFNPGGASIAPNQDNLEKDYKKELKANYNIEFNNLYAITNLPISRFLEDLIQKNQLSKYMETLLNAFNSSTVDNVMCTDTISVSYDGTLYDCDFNQMLNLKMDIESPNIKDFDIEGLNNRKIKLGQHCYGCTAGEGSSCQGAILN